jgi:hypothetical protein
MKSLVRIAVFLLLATIMTTSAGAFCLLSSQQSAFAASHHAGCHPAPVPSKSHPGDLQCCMNRHPSALLTSTFLLCPAQHSLAADQVSINRVLVARSSVQSLDTSSSSASPPRVTTLRI